AAKPVRCESRIDASPTSGVPCPMSPPRPPLSLLRRVLLACAALGVAAGSTHGQDPRSRDPIEGRWSGTITAPQELEAKIGFNFFRTSQGELIFRLNFPEMFTHDAVI